MLGDVEDALRHAIRCHDLTQANLELMHDFDIAYGYDGMARALGLVGQTEEARSIYAKARKAGAAITDEEDRGIFKGDFESGDWFGIV